ncbi:MAG: hypothetical protein KIT09_12085 [Bryobacteraceae bacterium]|nr:hypothetical protein [Bryobacteraceae bacterium]
MATAAASLDQAPVRFVSRWIVGRGVDLSLVIGSAAAGYLYLALNLLFQVPITFLWWFWSIGFDGTHIFATASRTYFDRNARRSERRLLLGSLVFFFSIGPAFVLAGQVKILAVLVGAWAYYHVLRQHYGFVMLYKVGNRDLDAEDNRLDARFLYLLLAAPPFHRFFVHHPEELGLPKSMALETALPLAEPAMWAGVIALTAAYLWRQLGRWRRREPLNAPKLLLMAAVIPLHWLTFAFMSWRAAVPTITIVHNLQYHALVWFHNRNRYGGAPAARVGRIPAAVSRSLIAYAALALVFSLAYRAPGHALSQASELAFGFFCGFGLTHYYLDSKIWRVRNDPSLRQALRLA